NPSADPQSQQAPSGRPGFKARSRAAQKSAAPLHPRRHQRPAAGDQRKPLRLSMVRIASAGLLSNANEKSRSKKALYCIGLPLSKQALLLRPGLEIVLGPLCPQILQVGTLGPQPTGMFPLGNPSPGCLPGHPGRGSNGEQVVFPVGLVFHAAPPSSSRRAVRTLSALNLEE